MVKVALTGGAYQAHSVIASAQRSLNLYSEPMPEGQGEPMPAAHYPTPGTRLLGTIGTGPIRGLRQCTTGGVYVVSGDTLYSVDISAWTGTALGTLTPGIKTPVSMDDNGLDMIVVDGSANGWDITLAANTFAQIPTTITDAPAPASATEAIVSGVARYTPFTPTIDGQVATATVSLGTGYTGQLQAAIFSTPAGPAPFPATSLGIANVVVNPASGSNTLTFQTPVAVSRDTVYWLGFDSNTSAGTWDVLGGSNTGLSSVTAFAGFPADNPGVSMATAVTCGITISNDPTGFFSGADRVDYLDTYFLFNKPGTPQFYISGSLAVTFDSLDFANKEAYSDLLVVAVVAKRLVYLFGERTTEIWYDAGATDIGAGSFPFAAMQSEVFIDHGCAAKYSPAIYDNSVFWLTRDRQGQGIVMMVAGYQTKRVSTYAIEAEIAGYERISDAIGFTYQLAGHSFYVLTFPHADKTWSYDITTGLWHEWLWIDTNGAEHRHRANCFWSVNDTLVVGDWQNGNLYALDQTVFTDNGQPIKRVRTYPHMLNDGKRVFYRQFLADLETGWAPEMLSGTETRLQALFTAADGTNLSAYVSDVGGGWTAIGAANAQIVGDKVSGLGGTALYQSAATILTPDYTLYFDVVPPVAGSVVSGNTVWAIGRATGANTGYRVSVSADGIQYTLTLATLPSGATASVAIGTIASGRFTVWLLLRGTNITAQVQRSVDGMWLRTDGIWRTDPGTIAAQFTDATYALPGAIMLGGTWPAPPAPTGLSYTVETPLASDPNFPSGHSNSFNTQSFDFTRNVFYQVVTGGGSAGIAITDLTTMRALRTVTLSQMYAGTSFGSPPGTPIDQGISDITCGNGTDIYIQTPRAPGLGTDAFTHFTRVDANTLKVTGDYFVSPTVPPPITCVCMSGGIGGAVNTTATHTIVAYFTNGNLGPEIFDGTGMAPVGLGFAGAPRFGNIPFSSSLIPGQKHGDGTCDFLYLNGDNSGHSGNIDIWRIKVSDGLSITSSVTGTANILSIFSPSPNLSIQQSNYDAAHNTIILWLSNNNSGNPLWIVSVNFNGSVNWVTPLPSDQGMYYSRGQSVLTGTTLMVGTSGSLKMLDTGTGAITFTGSIFIAGGTPAGSFYRVWDASRQSYWSYTLGLAFTRIDLPVPAQTLLAMDNVMATAQQTLLQKNLVGLRWSDDRGHSWGSPVTQSIGEAGEYRTSLQWQRMAYARDRVFEISWSVPMRTALQGCWIDVTPAQS